MFGASMASLAAITLLFPGTFLDRAWALNPTAHQQLAMIGPPAGVIFLVLAAVLMGAAAGWLRRRQWAWWLAVILISMQILGNLGNIVAGHAVRGALGATIASLLLLYILRVRTRAFASRETAP
jgi:hypothetical protein